MRSASARARVPDGRVNYTGSKPIAGQTVEVKVTGFGATKIPADAGTGSSSLPARRQPSSLATFGLLFSRTRRIFHSLFATKRCL